MSVTAPKVGAEWMGLARQIRREVAAEEMPAVLTPSLAALAVKSCTVRDAFSVTEMHDNYVSNPPDKRAEDAIRYLLPLTRYKIAFLLRTNFLHGIRRHRDFFLIVPLARVWILSPRPSCPPGIYHGIRDDYGCLIQPEETGS